jgi:hypothetical protein
MKNLEAKNSDKNRLLDFSRILHTQISKIQMSTKAFCFKIPKIFLKIISKIDIF